MNKGFKGCHPTVSVLYFFGAVIFGMLFQHPVCLVISLIASFLYYLKLKGKVAVKSLITFLLPMMLLVTIINGLFSHYGVTVLFKLFSGNNVTLESIVYGFITALTVVNVIIWFFCYNEIVTTDKFMYVFGKHIPKVALIISMALRFIPLYRERLHIIANAQKGIGLDYKSGSLIQRIKNGCKILSILITWSLENAIETSDSMRSRGYNTHKRNNYLRYDWTASDIILIIFLVLMILVFTVCVVTQDLKCLYNPQIIINSSNTAISYHVAELNMTYNSLSVFGIISVVLYLIFCALPILIDLKEDIKWKKLESKI